MLTETMKTQAIRDLRDLTGYRKDHVKYFEAQINFGLFLIANKITYHTFANHYMHFVHGKAFAVNQVQGIYKSAKEAYLNSIN